MARPETISRADLTRRLERVFLATGYDGASLARLSAASGLAKAALYHRFPGGKEEIALAVLDAAARALGEDVRQALAGPGDPAARLEAMIVVLRRFYEEGERPCLTDLFSVGDVPPCLRGSLAAGMDSWIAAIAGVLAEAGFDPEEAALRAEDAVVRVQGALVVSRATGDTGPFRRMAARLVADLLSR